MELALGLDSRDIPVARYADTQEQLERLEAEEKKYEAIIKASRIAKYGSLGAVPLLLFSDMLHSAMAFTSATVAAFAEDRAKQKSMALKIKTEEIKRAKNPQSYIEKAIENAAKDLEYAKEYEKHLLENASVYNGNAFAAARKRIEFQQKRLDLYSQTYELAKKNGKIEELSHLICRCESYSAIEPLITQVGAKEVLHGFGYLLGGALSSMALLDSYPTEQIGAGIILAEMGAIFVKNVARLIKTHKISKEEEKAYKTMEEFAQKYNKQEKVR